MTSKFIPNGFHTVTPYLTVQGADRLLDFVKAAFNAEQVLCMKCPDGTINHAAVKIGDSMVELAEAQAQWLPMLGAIHLYVSNTDEVYQCAILMMGENLPHEVCYYPDSDKWLSRSIGKIGKFEDTDYWADEPDPPVMNL